jgi:hypothetical protein
MHLNKANKFCALYNVKSSAEQYAASVHGHETVRKIPKRKSRQKICTKDIFVIAYRIEAP